MKILDAGYVEKIEHWGSDERIVEAARMSTGKGFTGWGPRCAKCKVQIGKVNDVICPSCRDCYVVEAGDEKLLRYLSDHGHSTPFEMAGLSVEVKAPIMVFREWFRHRTQSYNEMSARYTPLPDENYSPTVERLMLGSDGKNKQAGTDKGADVLTDVAALAWLDELSYAYETAQKAYEHGLAIGVPKELARLCVPVGRYSRMRASANLRNGLGFLTLRMDKAAQWEIRQYANAVGGIIAATFPRTWELFVGKERS